VHFKIEKERSLWDCAVCGGRHVVSRGTEYRQLRAVPIGGKQVFLDVSIARVECKDCGAVRQVPLGIADPRRSYTRQFERYAIDLLDLMSLSAVARHLGVGWDLVKEIDKKRLSRRYGKPKLRKLRWMAIDEINVGRGRFLTLVLDLVSGAVVFVGQGKSGDALTAFWRRLRASRARVKAVAMDMSKAYVKAVREHLPGAEIVFDRFHIMKLYNEKLSDLRRQLFREAWDEELREILKGTRWLLLMNRERLEAERPDDVSRLERALALNEPLAKAYYMKEDLRWFWQMDSKDAARLFLNDWIDEARRSGVRMLEKLADTIETHEKGLLAWYDYPISTGPMEGTNNKIGAMTRQAYGFRDHEYFVLRILGLHKTRRELVG
jgi:transposase